MDKIFSQRAEHSSTFATDDRTRQLAECTDSLPAKLYRVQYGSCQTMRDTRGLHAKDQSSPLPSLPEFAKSIEYQFNWNHRIPTRYISLFSDEVYARNWAIKRSEYEGQPCDLITITTDRLSRSTVFKLSNLVASLDLNIPDGAVQHVSGAYVCLYCVPSHAIGKIDVIDGSMLRLRSA